MLSFREPEGRWGRLYGCWYGGSGICGRDIGFDGCLKLAGLGLDVIDFPLGMGGGFEIEGGEPVGVVG